jgi:hypothetical protein
MSTGVFQFAAPERHHPTGTLETVQFGVSNVPGSLLGPEIPRVGGWPSWPSGVLAEAASGRAAHRARTQHAHHACIGSSGYKTARTMTCHAWWTGRLCAYIHKYQSDSIYLRTGVYTAEKKYGCIIILNCTETSFVDWRPSPRARGDAGSEK